MDLKKELTGLLIDSLEELIRIGSSNSFWGATRANSDAILALTTCLPEFDYYRLKSKCVERIVREVNESNQFVNWDEEIWDTSIAIMALASDYGNNKDIIHKALCWIESKYIKLSQSWNEEVWETLLALNAITYLGKNLYKSNNEINYFEGSINWINSLYDTPRKGILINWSSTALYLLFAVNSTRFDLNFENKKLIDEHIKTSCEQILNSPISQYEDSFLWTSETWSNGLVLWAISEAKMGMFNYEKLKSIIDWFRKRISLDETPIEDKAFACIGLYKYLEYIESVENKSDIGSQAKERLQLRLSKLINLRVKDFEPKPPLFDKSFHSNYYTINLSKRTVNVTFILIATVILTYFSILTSNENDNFSKWLSIIPILLGVFATVSQLMNFEILPSKNKNNEK